MNRRFVPTAGWRMAAITGLCAFSFHAAALDANQEIIASCVACHGANGIGKADQYPNLQNQKTAYMVKQLRDFKSGARKDATMTTIAQPLSEADIQMLAKFFAQVK